MMSSKTPRIFADFNNCDRLGRVRLNTVGTAEDLNRLRLELSEGTALVVTDSELETEAVATYSEDEKMWVAKIDPTKVRSLPPQS